MKHIAILILVVVSVNVNSQAVRKYSNEFLKIGVGGKYLGTGGSLVTSESDPASVLYNPVLK